MKVKESPFQQGLRLVLQDLAILYENPQDQDAAKAIQEHLKVITEKYKKNILFELLQKMLFGMGVYHHQDVSLKLFHLKKRNVEKLVTAFRRNEVEGVIAHLVSQLYIKLDQDTFGELIRKVVSVLGTTIYDGNEQARIIKFIREKVQLEIFEDEEEDNVEFKRVVQRRKVEKSMIIFDDDQKEIYWPKESFEDFVQQIKKYQEYECLSHSLDLIEKIREKQTNIIIDVNSVGQDDLASIPEHLRKKFEKLKTENESVRSLISQGFNTNSFHFILEFIQNADDSEYLQDGTLEFDFDNNLKMLKIKSNESGFTFDNLYALSGIADSDKVAKKLETPAIGEKGIGFKTVFSVCDKVHLVSNGFDVVLTSLDLKRKDCEAFNLNEGTLYEIEIEKFDHSIFDKYTLLTLKNIKTIIFKDNSKITTYTLTQDGIKNTLKTIVKENGKEAIQLEETFYSFSEEINMKNVLCEKRPNFHNAKLILFFPEKWENKFYKLHSYLPVKEDYNLPLLIQSDFILSQNREALIEDSQWNITIIDHIPNLLVNSFNTLKDVNSWKYDFFRMLKTSPKLHFEHIQSNTINLLKSTECVPIINPSKGFETPCKVLLMREAPVNPFEVFGTDECTKILNKECVDDTFEKELILKEWDDSFTNLSPDQVILLAKELPYKTKLDKIEQLFELFEHFKINVMDLDFEIVPTRLHELVKPTTNIFDGYDNFSEGALKILEKASLYSLKKGLKEKYKRLKVITKIPQLDKQLTLEEIFVLIAECPDIISQRCCLTQNKEWIDVDKCYIESIHTNYLENAEFADSKSLEQILKQNNSSSINIEKILINIGVKKVPIFFKIHSYSYQETPEFTLLRKKYSTIEKLIEYFDAYFELFEDQIGGIKYFLANNILNLYDPSLRQKFGDAIDYLPTIKNGKLKSNITARKEDFEANRKLIEKSKTSDSIINSLKSYRNSTLQLLEDKPLLRTTDNDYVKLDSNLFSSMDVKLQKYRPEWKETASKYQQITQLTRDHSSEEYKLVLRACSVSLEDQQYFIKKILPKSASKYGIYVEIDGKKNPLSEMYWDLEMREIFPEAVNAKLLYPHFSSNTIKKYIESNNNITKSPELHQILSDRLKTILDDGISTLEEKHKHQVRILVSAGFNFTLPSQMVWDLYELNDIPFFLGLDLSRKFDAYSDIVKNKDTQKDRTVSQEHIQYFLKSDNVSDEQFLKVWKYCKRTAINRQMEMFIYKNGLIVCHNQKHTHTDLFTSKPELLEHFPDLKLYQASQDYHDFQISKEVPIHLIYNEIEKLEQSQEADADEKCLILYKEIDHQIRDGLLESNNCQGYKIFRSDKGKHCERIYLCDNQELYSNLSNIVDCLFVRNLTGISHFIEHFEIVPLSQTISFHNPKITESTKDINQPLEKFTKLMSLINKYLSHKNNHPKDIKLQVFENFSVTAKLENENSKEISPEIHPDIENGIIYVKETIIGNDIFKNKQFIICFLQFYPQLEDSSKDFLKLLIASHSSSQDHDNVIDIAMSLIL